ncbi:MAG: hypothetical protein V1781_09545 [Bacteroidota bacterium]
MTNRETIRKNIELTFDFVRHLIDNTQLAEQLPDKCEIDFIESDFSSLTEKELTANKLVKVNRTFDLITKRKTRITKDKIKRADSSKLKQMASNKHRYGIKVKGYKMPASF